MIITTQEEARNTFQFRAIKKSLKLQYKWVIDVLPPSDNDIKKYRRLFFINLVVDPFILSKELNLPLANYVLGYMRRNEEYGSTTMVTFFDYSHLDSIGEGKEDVRDYMRSVNVFVNNIFNSKAIPHEIKLDNYTNCEVIEYFIPANITIPQDFINDYNT